MSVIGLKLGYISVWVTSLLGLSQCLGNVCVGVMSVSGLCMIPGYVNGMVMSMPELYNFSV